LFNPYLNSLAISYYFIRPKLFRLANVSRFVNVFVAFNVVSLAGMAQSTVKTPVINQQVAPTVIKALGFDPNQLQAVQKEQITVSTVPVHQLAERSSRRSSCWST
jgi:hypothetical protein